MDAVVQKALEDWLPDRLWPDLKKMYAENVPATSGMHHPGSASSENKGFVKRYERGWRRSFSSIVVRFWHGICAVQHFARWRLRLSEKV